jgi:hypothetical protein
MTTFLTLQNAQPTQYVWNGGTRQAGSNTKPSNYFEFLTSTWLSPFMGLKPFEIITRGYKWVDGFHETP